MTEAQLRVVHGGDLAGSQLQHLQSGFLCDALQSDIAQINDAVEIEVSHDLCHGVILAVQESLTCQADLFHIGGDLVQTVQIQCQISSQIHVAVAGGHGEGLVVGFGSQVQSKAVAAAVSQLGQSALVVAGDKQVVQVLADHLSGLYIAQGLGGIAGTAEVHQQSGLGAGQGVLRRGDDVGGGVGLDLEVILLVQGVIQGIADKFAGTCTGQNDVKVICLHDLIQESLQFCLAGSQLCTGLAPGGGLLIDLVNCKGGGRSLHLFFGEIENAHHL